MLDFIAIGLGPFNLSLASLLHEKTELHYLFFEKKSAVRLACRYATSQYGLASSIHGGFGVDGRSDQSVEFFDLPKIAAALI